jgi:WD40 repeat protein/uncharacterized protein YjbI with pentapeptide repeats
MHGFTKNPTFNKRELFTSVFQEEFLRELDFLWDVMNGRATSRDGFTQRLISLLQAVSPKLPVISDVVTKLLDVAAFAASHERDKLLSHVANIREQLDVKRLQVLARVVAREAYRRYEYFIEYRLSDEPERGVIPFAKIGVARCLEYLARKRSKIAAGISLELNESLLLAGLVEGRSGAWIDGWTNHQMLLQPKAIAHLNLKSKEIAAETVYARSGMVNFSIRNERSEQHYYTRKQALHHESGILEKLRKIYQGETESLFDFGYTQFRSSEPYDPKAGFVIMPAAVIAHYDFQQQTEDKHSEKLKSEYQNEGLQTVEIDCSTLKAYCAWYRRQNDHKLTICDYLRREKIWRGAQVVICSEDLTDLDISGINLSDMDLSGAIISGNISNTNFSRCILIGSQFKKIVNASNANFTQVDGAFLQAPGANFNGAIFSQADISFADLEGADLSGCQILGTIWYQAKLQRIISTEDLLVIQQKQHHKLIAEQDKQRAQIKALQLEFHEQQRQLQILQENLQKNLTSFASSEFEQRKMADLLKLIQQLQANQHDRLAFERYCQQQLQTLQGQIDNLSSKEIREFSNRLKTIEDYLQEHSVTAVQQEIEKTLGNLQQQTDTFEAVLLELKAQTRSQMERQKDLQLAFNAIKENLEQRLSKVEHEVKIVVERVAQLTQKLDASDLSFTVTQKLLKLRTAILNDPSARSETHYYIPSNGKPVWGNDNATSPLAEWIEHEFLLSDKRVLLLQGQAGAGKSTFTRYLLRKLWQDPAWENLASGQVASQVLLPIWIPLGQQSHESLKLLDYLTHLPQLADDFTIAEIEFLQQHYRLLIIADGYDETQQRQAINLFDANHLDKFHGRIKLLISCRSSRVQELDVAACFAPHDAHGKPNLDQLVQYEVALFNAKQRDAYIEKYVAQNPNGIWDTTYYTKKINALPELSELLTTPFLLFLTLKALPQIENELATEIAEVKLKEQSANKLTRAKLVEYCMQNWFERQAQKAQEQGETAPIRDLIQDYWQFSFKLAENLQRANVVAVQYPSRTQALFAEQSDISELGPQGRWVEQLFGNSNERINRARKGAPLQMGAGNYYQFIHGLLLDFFATSAIAKSKVHVTTIAPVIPPRGATRPISAVPPPLPPRKGALKVEAAEIPSSHLGILTSINAISEQNPAALILRSTIEMLNERLLSRDQWYLLADRVLSDENFKSTLFDLIEQSKHNAAIAMAAANAVSVLNAAKINFSGLDWSGIKIPGADLSGAILDQTILAGADLTGVNFQNAWLLAADFTSAQLNHVNWGQISQVNLQRNGKKCVYSPDGKWVAVAALYGETIEIIDTSSWQTVNCLSVSEYKLYLMPSTELLSAKRPPFCIPLKKVGQQIIAYPKNKEDEKIILQLTEAEIQFLVFPQPGWPGQIVSWQDNPSLVDSIKRQCNNRGALVYQYVHSIAWSPDSTKLAAAKYRQFFVWDTHSWQLIKTRLCVLEHEDSTLSWDPTGNILAISSNTKGIRLCDLREVEYSDFSSIADELKVNAYEWNPINGQLAIYSSKNKLRIYDTEQDIEVKLLDLNASLHPHLKKLGKSLSEMHWNAQGDKIAFNVGNVIKIWDIAEDHECASLEDGEDNTITCFTWEKQGLRLATGHEDGTIKIWERTNNVVLLSFKAHGNAVKSISWDPLNDYVVSCSEEETTLRIWNINAKKDLRQLSGYAGNVGSNIAWRPRTNRFLVQNYRLLAHNDDNYQICEIDATNGQMISQAYISEIDPRGQIAWHPNGEYFAVCEMSDEDRKGTVFLHRVYLDANCFAQDQSGQLSEMSAIDRVRLKRQFYRQQQEVQKHLGLAKYQKTKLKSYDSGLAWDPSGTRLIASCDDGKHRIWHVASGRELCCIDFDRQASYFSWHPTIDVIAIATKDAFIDSPVTLWNASTGENIPIPNFGAQLINRKWEQGLHQAIKYMAWSPNGKYLIAADAETIAIWQRDEQQLRYISYKEQIISTMVWSPNSKFIGVTSNHNVLSIWDIENLSGEVIIKTFPTKIDSIAWELSTEGKPLLILALFHSLACYEVASQSYILELKLLWLTGKDNQLVTHGTTIHSSYGLSEQDKLMLKRNGAVGEPSDLLMPPAPQPRVTDLLANSAITALLITSSSQPTHTTTKSSNDNKSCCLIL